MSEQTAWVVRHHGLFQGYYYYHHLGGDRDERERYADSPHYDRCVDFCASYDQNCFDPDYDELPLEDFCTATYRGLRPASSTPGLSQPSVMDAAISQAQRSGADSVGSGAPRSEPPDSDQWFKPSLTRATLTRLSQRSDSEALKRVSVYFALLAAFGAISTWLWLRGSWWFLASYAVYCFVWSFANATEHEACHYTPFRRLWLNNALLYTSSWMLNWEPVTVRWVHARHHTYTSIVGADAEYLLPNPIRRRDLANLVLGTNHFWNYNKELVQLAIKRPNATIGSAVPTDDMALTTRNARMFLLAYAAVIGSCFVLWTPLPVVILMLPRVIGEPMHGVLRALQHGGLETEAADHRRTTRSMYVSQPLQWLYCNMNFHIEHHMYPMVPFHALPALHTEIKDQLPVPTAGYGPGWQRS